MNYSIWYMRPEWFRDGSCGAKPDPYNLKATHIHLMDFIAIGKEDELEGVYSWFQAENWSPNGEAKDLIHSKGLEHTSMSVGDIIIVNGQKWIVNRIGFGKLE